MTDLTAVIHDLVRVFESQRLPHAIMGGPLGVERQLDEVLAARE